LTESGGEIEVVATRTKSRINPQRLKARDFIEDGGGIVTVFL
jgi:hypothetical protein